MKASSVAPGRADASKRLRIVLVDAHPVIRVGMTSMLGADGDLVVVGEADNGLTAVRMALELQPDVILMEVFLPELGGAEASKQILAAQPTQRILALSAYDDPSCARRLLDGGAAGFALKRAAADELVRAVRTVAAGGIYVDPWMTGALLAGAKPAMRPMGLSAREAQVIRLFAQGHSTKHIAEILNLSGRTLETYKNRAMQKLDLDSRHDLVLYAARCGWLRDGV